MPEVVVSESCLENQFFMFSKLLVGAIKYKSISTQEELDDLLINSN